MKDILVTLDTTSNTKTRLNAAIEMADKFQAHLTGLYVVDKPNTAFLGGSMDTIVIQNMFEEMEKQREQVTKLFHEATDSRREKTSLVDDAEIWEYPEYAAINDLVVVGQADPNESSHSHIEATNDFIMKPGRPALVIPHIGYSQPIGKFVLVAWDRSKEASRAIHDALPLLKMADTVKVVSVYKKAEENQSVDSADMAEHLARHDVKVETDDIIRNDVPVAETLLSTIADTGADMLVMGAYGHSRLREFTFGGTTRTLLESMTVPVLMTH